MTEGQNNKTAIIIAIITLAGGTTTALIANWDKITGSKERVAMVAKESKPDVQNTRAFDERRKYSGNVGKWPTTYELTWHEDGSIEGTYAYFERQTNDKYELKGRKVNESSIELTEYINGVQTASALLVKKDNCYAGKIKNKDYVNSGRMFDMSICE